MQTSGTFPGLSDGTRKTVVGATPPKRQPSPVKPVRPAVPVTAHRRGGFAKHATGR